MSDMMSINTGTSFVKVPSESEPGKEYVVEIENGRAWWCECKDWQVRRREGGCKHMKAVQGDLDAVAAMMGSLLSAENIMKPTDG